MASFQILDLSFEENLSDDRAGTIQGGQDRITETLNFLQDFYNDNNLSEFYGSFGEFYSQLLAIYDEPRGAGEVV
ncbi:MAG: hypothetical protein AB4372_26425 [Xenococcus sp. (in: cyanobacteria)]